MAVLKGKVTYHQEKVLPGGRRQQCVLCTADVQELLRCWAQARCEHTLLAPVPGPIVGDQLLTDVLLLPTHIRQLAIPVPESGIWERNEDCDSKLTPVRFSNCR